MKKLLLPMLLLGLSAVLIVSCQKEELEIKEVSDAPVAAEERGVGPAVDLEIVGYGSIITGTTTVCTGAPLPNISCAGGQRFFTAIIAIRINGPDDLPPGTIMVLWADLTTNSQQQTIVTHQGIPAGTSIRASRPYFVGPCDCPPPFTPFVHSFMAFVDPGNCIPETNEANNRSPQYDTCDGC